MRKDEFIEELNKIGINATEEQLNKLEIYKEFLIKYNQHTNLTRIIDEKDIYLKHFYDSLTIVKFVDLNKVNDLLDIGTGAGFPGMVLKIFFPNIKVTLLDSNNKKINFLKELTSKLKIDIDLVNDRAENYIKNNREHYDIVVSRAVAPLPILLELSIPFVKVKGLFISMKAIADEELELSKNTHTILGANIKSVNKFYLVKEKSQRTIIIYEKVSNTDTKYPRLYDQIKKKPIN